MSSEHPPTRRRFLGTAAAGTGLMTSAGVRMASSSTAPDVNNRGIPGEIWVASLSLYKCQNHRTTDQRIGELLNRMERIAVFQPDIICLPEICQSAWIHGRASREEVAKLAETVPGSICRRFGDFAKQHRCYVALPIWTTTQGHSYNTAVLIGRDGQVAGQYRKIHPTEGEMKQGIAPGPQQPVVFQTDFGIIGILICFDAIWPDEWSALKKAGARLVFWPSAYHGGRMLNSHALVNKFHIVSSTWPDPPRIIDMTGLDRPDLAEEPGWVCGPINMEKEILHLDDQLQKLQEAQAHYGKKIHLTVHPLEDHATLESRSPDITVRQVMQEYGLITWDAYHHRATGAQDDVRSRA